MRRFFEYRRLAVAPRTWGKVAGPSAEAVQSAAAQRDAALYGLWLGQIGLERDEGILMTAWNSLETMQAEADAVAASRDWSTVETVRLGVTVRPESDQRPGRPGFYAHRWFEMPTDSWPEFVDLSADAWPSMEQAVDAHIEGLWREVSNSAQGVTRVLLLTHYAHLSDWENSRWWGRPDPAAEAAMARFKRRTELVQRTTVTISTLPE